MGGVAGVCGSQPSDRARIAAGANRNMSGPYQWSGQVASWAGWCYPRGYRRGERLGPCAERRAGCDEPSCLRRGCAEEDARSMAYDVKVINELVQRESVFTERIVNEVGKVIVGQRYMV